MAGAAHGADGASQRAATLDGGTLPGSCPPDGSCQNIARIGRAGAVLMQLLLHVILTYIQYPDPRLLAEPTETGSLSKIPGYSRVLTACCNIAKTSFPEPKALVRRYQDPAGEIMMIIYSF